MSCILNIILGAAPPSKEEIDKMKIKSLSALLTVFAISLSLVSCGNILGGTPPADSEAGLDSHKTTETENTPETEEAREIVTRTYKIAENLDSIKTLGRTSVSDEGLICDNVASGIEFNAYIEGELVLDLTISRGSVTTNGTVENSLNDDCYFTLYIDGIRADERIKAGKSSRTSLTLASFESGELHSIRIVKQTEPRNALALLEAVSFTGYLLDRPADGEYYIEFIGASTSCGYGNLTTVSSAAEAQKAINQDSTQAFPYLTAQKLGADYSVVGASGIGLVRGFRPFNMPFMLGLSSAYRSQTDFYEPTRIPDAVVINLSGNDYNKGVTADEWRAGMLAFVAQLRGMYGKDLPIICVYMKSNTYFPELTQSIFNDLGGEECGLYLCKTTNNTDGGNNHHSIAGQNLVAEELAEFIRSNDILNLEFLK